MCFTLKCPEPAPRREIDYLSFDQGLCEKSSIFISVYLGAEHWIFAEASQWKQKSDRFEKKSILDRDFLYS